MPEPVLRGQLGCGPGLDKVPENMSGGERDTLLIVTGGRKGNCKYVPVRSWEFLSEVLFSFVSKEGKLSAEGGGKRAYLKDSVELKRHKIAPVEREREETLHRSQGPLRAWFKRWTLGDGSFLRIDVLLYQSNLQAVSECIAQEMNGNSSSCSAVYWVNESLFLTDVHSLLNNRMIIPTPRFVNISSTRFLYT